MDLTPLVWIGVGCFLWHLRGRAKRAAEPHYDPTGFAYDGPYVQSHPRGWADPELSAAVKTWRAGIRRSRRRRG